MCPIKAVSIPSCLLILPTNPAQQFTIKRKLTAGNQIFMGNIIVYRRQEVDKICPGLGGYWTGRGSCSIELKIFTVICPRATNSVQMWRIDSSSLVRGAAPRDNAIALWSVGRKCAKPEPSQNQVTITAHTLCVLLISDSAFCDISFMFLFWEPNLGATLWVLRFFFYEYQISFFCIQYIGWNCIFALQWTAQRGRHWLTCDQVIWLPLLGNN